MFNCKNIKRIFIISLFFSAQFLLGQTWDKLNGPEGAWVWQGTKTLDGNLFIGTDGGGVYRSGDDGVNWQQVGNELVGKDVRSILAKGNMLFAGTFFHGIFRSNDLGSSWTSISTGLPGVYIQAIAVAPNGDIWIGVYNNGIYKSADNGDTWDLVSDQLDGRIMQISFHPSGYVMASTFGGGIFKSTDGGNSWVQKNSSLSHLRVWPIYIHNNSTVYLGTYGGGLYKSDDDCENWTKLDQGLDNENIHSICNLPSTDILLAGTRSGVYQSDDLGSNWALKGITDDRVYALFNEDSRLLAGGMSGIYFRKTDETWAQSSSGINSFHVYQVKVDPDGDYYLGTVNGVFYSGDRASSLVRRSNGLNTLWIFSMSVFRNDQIFAGTTNGIYLTSDKGVTWNFKGLTGSVVEAIHKNIDNNIFAGTYPNGLFLSNNNGDSWQTAGSGITDNDVPAITGLDEKLYAGCWTDGVFRSDDKGMSWVAKNNNLGNLEIRSLAVTQEPLFVYAGTVDGVFRSQDYAETWTRAGTELVGMEIKDIIINSRGRLFVATKMGGIYTSTDEGSSWQLLDGQTSTGKSSSLALDENEYLLVGTYNGLFRTQQPTITKPPLLQTPQDNATDINLQPTLSWQSDPWFDTFHIQVSEQISFSSLVHDIENHSGNSIQLGTLDPNTVYYWRVASVNEFDHSSWSSVFSFTTAPAGLTAPALTDPQNNATGVQITTSFAWTAVTGADRYHLQIADVSDFTSIVVNNEFISGTTHQPTGLTFDTQYYWRVRAVNTSDTGPWSAEYTFHTESGLAGPLLDQPADGEQDVPVNVRLQWLTDSGADYYYIRIGESSDFSTIVEEANDIQENYYDTRNLDFNETYYWQVSSRSNSSSANGWSNVRSFRTRDYPSTITAATTFNFRDLGDAGDYTVSDYKLIGVPGDAGILLTAAFGDQIGTQWTAYWDNGASSNYFQEATDSDPFRFVTGRGFWFIHAGPISLSKSISTANLNTNMEAEISLHDGWNIITNPFPYTVVWNGVEERNSITDPIVKFESGSFNTATFMEPYKGYYFFNRNSLSTLFIPVKSTVSKPVTQNDEIEWKITINLRTESKYAQPAEIGISPFASLELDNLDHFLPRAPGDISAIVFHRPQWNKDFSEFMSDYRPQVGELQRWDFIAFHPEFQKSEMSFEGVENIDTQYEVVLIDHTHSRSVDLRKESIVEIIPQLKSTRFEILVGNTAKVAEVLEEMLPREFELIENYPNPFNPNTIIPVSVPVQSHLTLKIYDILGQEIKSLAAGNFEPGKYYFSWDASDAVNSRVAAGVYFYRLQINHKTSLIRKMVLIK